MNFRFLVLHVSLFMRAIVAGRGGHPLTMPKSFQENRKGIVAVTTSSPGRTWCCAGNLKELQQLRLEVKKSQDYGHLASCACKYTTGPGTVSGGMTNAA
jgi:hypothetical protein